MLYSTHELKVNPSFKMDKIEFNTLVNNLSEDPTGKEAVIGLTIRTINSNRVCTMDDSVVLPIEINKHDMEGYFSLLKSIQLYLIDKIGNNFSLSLVQTVLMPVGAFTLDNKIFIYFNLLIQDEIENQYTTSELQFRSINSLDNLNSISKVVVPTLTIVENAN